MSAAMTADQKLVKQSWQKAYKAALDADIWGQADDAHDNYYKLSENIDELTNHIDLSNEEKAHLYKFRQCLALRNEALQANTGAILASINTTSTPSSPSHPTTPATATATAAASASHSTAQPAISLDHMKRLTRVLDELFSGQRGGVTSDFPIVVPAVTAVGKSNKSGAEKIILSPTEEKTQESDEGGSLLPPRQLSFAHIAGSGRLVLHSVPALTARCCVVLVSAYIATLPAGSHAVSLHISTIGLKDAPSYVNPHLRIILAPASYNPATQSPTSPAPHIQDTPYLTLSSQSACHLLVHRTIHLPLSVEMLRSEDWTCYVEVRHWKGAKKKVSVRCWAMMEVDEMVRAAEAVQAAEVVAVANGAGGAVGTGGVDGQVGEGEANGEVCLELYQKPVDYRKKRLNLFSVKQLYLTLSCQIKQQ